MRGEAQAAGAEVKPKAPKSVMILIFLSISTEPIILSLLLSGEISSSLSNGCYNPRFFFNEDVILEDGS